MGKPEHLAVVGGVPNCAIKCHDPRVTVRYHSGAPDYNLLDFIIGGAEFGVVVFWELRYGQNLLHRVDLQKAPARPLAVVVAR